MFKTILSKYQSIKILKSNKPLLELYHTPLSLYAPFPWEVPISIILADKTFLKYVTRPTIKCFKVFT